MHVAKLCMATLFAAVIVAAIAVLPQRLCFEGGASYTFYCGTSSADCKEVTVKSNASLERLCLKNVCGEATLYKNFDLESFLKQVDGEIVFVEEFCDGINYYCTANLPYKINLYGKEINLHVAVRGDTAKVASPIIFGGY